MKHRAGAQHVAHLSGDKTKPRSQMRGQQNHRWENESLLTGTNEARTRRDNEQIEPV
jgi:hypothetical protein